MKVSSKIKVLLGAMAVAAASLAHADNWPARPLKLIVSQGAGGSTDTIARTWAEYVGRAIGQPIVVENRPGAGGIIAAQAVLAQPADGYTLFLAGVSQMVLNKFVYKPLAYDPDKDFVGVATMSVVPFVLVANPATGFKSFGDLKSAALAKPERLNFASSGRGNSTHLVVELLQKQSGIRMSHIPYRGETDGVVATASGNTEIMAPTLSTALPLIKSGKLVPLLLLSKQRNPDLPDLPTAKELGMEGFDDIGWAGIAAKSGTPPEVLAKLHAATNAFLDDPATVAKFQSMQTEVLKSDQGALMRYTARDTIKWRDAIGNLELSPN
ncbi:ABC transporter substrate-binding protein [Bordetella sp. H567]|uniref:Bug family tripartite tricarboxylate transporter substrate binding protein n=1 Tax=Bordetella sp. H567 TaxID=1697043 RepID=UPI00081CB9B3|nr:tripartite tricarboxylate transporter substrate binding protein [Bordetella sp. H567]AOB31450.1 ABC transporter substrate-binding protein [Bordetella sp. H567]